MNQKAWGRKVLPCGRVLAPDNPPPSKEQLNEWQKQLKNYLSSKALKYTEQRWSIAEIILQKSGHIDAQGIVQIVKEVYPNIGAATVYRNIKVLCDAGILEESHQDTTGKTIYELQDDSHHDHIICMDCGEIFEFHDHTIEGLQEKVSKNMNFQLAGHRHVIHGHCEFLRRKKHSD